MSSLIFILLAKEAGHLIYRDHFWENWREIGSMMKCGE